MSNTTITPAGEIDHEARRSRLHATDVPAILGLSPYRGGHEVWLEKTGRLDPWAGSDATRMGQRLEAAVLDHAEADLGVTLERNVLALAADLPFPLAATLDAVAGGNVPVEAKTSGIVGPIYGQWGEPETDEVPEVYLVQVVAQMICSGGALAHLYALLGGRGILHYRVARDAKVASAIIDACAVWWYRHIERGDEPPRDTLPSLDVAKRLRRSPGLTVDFDAYHASLVTRWQSAREAKIVADKTADAAQAELLMALGEAEAADLPDGRQLTYFAQQRKAYSVAASSFRVLRLKKGN